MRWKVRLGLLVGMAWLLGQVAPLGLHAMRWVGAGQVQLCPSWAERPSWWVGLGTLGGHALEILHGE
eukprot:1138793-Pelagomonas_calceolata.AAC.2